MKVPVFIMKQKTHKKCANPDCGKEFKLFRTTDKYCSRECEPKKEFKPKKQIVFKPRKPINKTSKKQKVLLAKYTVARIEFLSLAENKVCFIEGCHRPSTTIEHRRGRVGFADDWARENNIPLLIDKRFFAGCCLQHNLELENNPELSKQYQISKIHGGKKGT